MTDRLPGKYKSELHTKPWFFSGKVPDIRYSYTVSGLTPSSYPIRPRSIIPGAKLSNHPYLGLPNVDESKEQSFSRQFKEYSFIREQEVLVTIEHCDNCEDHASTTHHDAEKYSYLAQTLKNAILSRYSLVKILIKPLSKLDPEVNKKRLGAFEVQLASKTRGQLSVQVIHSKLATRKWPDVSQVIQKISKFLPSCRISVTVFDENSNTQSVKGIKVLLTPKPIELDQLRPSSNYSALRPKSAATARSCKSFRAMSSRRISRKDLVRPKQEIVYEKVTDRDGVCAFESVPLDVYEVEVPETRDYQGCRKTVNVFEEKNQSSLNILIGLKSRDNCNVTVLLRDSLLKTEVSQAKVLIRKDGAEYYLSETKKGLYEISVPKGEYFLAIITGKYCEVNKKVNAVDQEVVVSESLDLKKAREVLVSVFDVLQVAPLNGVVLEITVNRKHKQSGVTKGGNFLFQIEELGLIDLKAHFKGYAKTKIQIYAGAELKNINVGLLSLTVEQPVVLVSWPRFSDEIELSGQLETGEISLARPELEGHLLKDKLKTHGFAAFFLDSRSKNLRISIKGLTKDLSSQNGFALSGLSVQYFTSRKLRNTIRPTAGTGEWWDVGVFSVKHQDFIETNFVSNYKLPVNEFFSDFQSLFHYISIVDSVASAFAFSHGVSKTVSYGKDVFLSPDVFKKSLLHIVSPDFTSWFTQSVASNDGISLMSLEYRFKRYVGLGLNPLQDFQKFTEKLDLDDEEIPKYKKIIEEAYYSTLPNGWQIGWNLQGDFVYLDEEGHPTAEFPGIAICKKKILELKKEEIKKKNQDASKEQALEKEKKEKEQRERLKIASDKISEFQKLIDYSGQVIEGYFDKGRFDQANHVELIRRISLSLQDLQALIDSHKFQEFSQNFSELSRQLSDVQNKLEEIYDEVLNRRNDSSSSSSKSDNKKSSHSSSKSHKYKASSSSSKSHKKNKSSSSSSNS